MHRLLCDKRKLATLITSLVDVSDSSILWNFYNSDRSLVPDITVFEWVNIPVDENGEIQNRFTVAPDWVIEILSPEQSPLRVIEKILFSLQQGEQFGWLIAPDDYSITIFHPDKLAEFKEQDDQLPLLPVLENWQVTASELFSWLRLI